MCLRLTPDQTLIPVLSRTVTSSSFSAISFNPFCHIGRQSILSAICYCLICCDGTGKFRRYHPQLDTCRK